MGGHMDFVGKIAHHFGGGDQLVDRFAFGAQSDENGGGGDGRGAAAHHLRDKIAHDGRR